MTTRTRSRTRRRVAATAAVGALALAVPTAALAGGSSASLKADLVGSLTEDAPVFGVNPGGLDWDVPAGSVHLHGGKLHVDVRGLVFTEGPFAGTAGPVAAVSASVYCGGAAAATTAAVPLSSAGDAKVRAEVALPDRCVAPVVLVHPGTNTGVFIAATGLLS